jgi:hypothetical protein
VTELVNNFYKKNSLNQIYRRRFSAMVWEGFYRGGAHAML